MKKIEKLVVCGFYETGLGTERGEVRIDDVTKDGELIMDFHKWLTRCHELLAPFKYSIALMHLQPGSIRLLQQHNRKGLDLSERIKKR